MKLKNRKIKKTIRHRRVRKKISGNSELPRLCVFKSSKHVYAQIIDDVGNRTLISASSLTPDIREILTKEKKTRVEAANLVGKYIAKLALTRGIKSVCFDRGGYLYHGRVKSLADGARESGLEF